MKKVYTVKEEATLSEFLSNVTVGLSKNKILSQIKRGEARVNGKKVLTDLGLNVGDEVSFFLPEYLQVSVPIIFSDQNVAIVDKPIHTEVETALTCYMQEKFPFAKPLHRLDANTSGLVAFALNQKAYDELLTAFKERKVRKTYLAETVGSVKDGIYEAYLLKDSKNSKVRICDTQKPDSKWIKTGIEFVEKGEINLAKITLFTGRTHQIRAHLAYLGCPIVGDDKYGDKTANKKYGAVYQKLKAVSLVFDNLNSPFDSLNGKVFSTVENLN